MRKKIRSVMGSAAAVVLAAAVLGAHAAVGRAGDTPSCDAQGGEAAYAIALRALTDPNGADLTLRASAVGAGCAEPTSLKKVQVKIFTLAGSLASTRNFTDVEAPHGVATLELGTVGRGQRVAAEALIQTGDPERTYVVRGETKTLLRPDLVVAAISAPRQVLAGRAFTVAAQIAERNGDVAATATVTLAAGSTALGTAPVSVEPGASATVTFDGVRLSTPGPIRLDVTVGNADPREADTTNNDGHAVVEVTEFEVDRSTVLVSNLAGYGGQFNNHVYAKLSQDVGVTPENVGQMEQKMIALEPQFSRIFFSPSELDPRFPDRLQSFIKTVLLAQTAGTTINVTWQGGALTDGPTGTIPRFANVLIDLVQNRGVTNLRWVTLQNEPNRTKITPEQLEASYRTLEKYLFPIRGQVKYMGGDLVRGPDSGPPNQQLWFDYMATHMADILDAWSIHVFWDFTDTQKLQDRLNEVRAIWDTEPADGRKPLYVSEYGVRGIRPTFNGAPVIDPGVWTDGTPITQTNVNAFQHAWFDILSARRGYLGTSKWDSYFGKYDNGTQAYYMIGRPQEGWPLYPIYHLLRLWTLTLKRGWQVVQLDGATAPKLLAAYTGPNGEVTVTGLDTDGAQLNSASTTQVAYSVGGLPPSTSFRLVVWNAAGDGGDALAPAVTSDAAGVATFEVPLQAVFALTTLPVTVG
jgi:hypothetical protein